MYSILYKKKFTLPLSIPGNSFNILIIKIHFCNISISFLAKYLMYLDCLFNNIFVLGLGSLAPCFSV